MTGPNTSHMSYRVARIALTPLNLETTARYQRCLAAGTHRPGSSYTAPRVPPRYQAQNVGYLEMPICPVCEVPILPRGNTAFAARMRGT